MPGDTHQRIALFLNDDPVFLPEPLGRFLSRLAPRRVEKLYVFPAIPDPAKARQWARTSAAIVGPRFLAGYLLRMVLQRGAIERVARHHGLKVERFSDVNSEELRRSVREAGITVGLSWCSQIYREGTLSIPGFRLFNFHPALLPRNQGKYPFFWAFLNRDARQGVTCHQITRGIDSGPIVFQRLFPESVLRDVPSAMTHLSRISPELMLEALDRIESGSWSRITSEDEAPWYGPRPTPEQIREYHRLIRGKSRVAGRS